MTDEQLNARKGNVLIVDDTLPNLRVLAKMLTQNGYLVRGVPSGAMALAAATSEPPDLILLDIMMPGIDGFNVCKELKADPSTHNIRVLAMTGYPSVENVDRILQAGAELCLEKPIDTGRLLDLLRLEQRQGFAHAHS